jgi:hypothetical protein
MSPEEELALISTLLDEHGVPKTRGLGVYSVYGRVALLAEKAAQQSVHLTGGTVPPANIDQRPEVDSAGEDNQRPAASR